MNRKVLLAIIVYFGVLVILDLIDFILTIEAFGKVLINFIFYPIFLTWVVFFLKDEFKNSLFNKKKASIIKSVTTVLVGFLLLLLGQKFINFIKTDMFGMALSESQNENLIQTFPILVIVSAIIAPIIEEIIFRRVILSLFIKKYNILHSIMISSIIFAGWHLTLNGFPNLFWFSIVLSAAYYYTNRLAVPIAIHIMINTIVGLVSFM